MMVIDQTTVLSVGIFCITLIVITALRLKCRHQYTLEQKVQVVDPDTEKTMYRKYISRCIKCGKLHKDEL